MKNEHGITLVELLISIFIISVISTLSIAFYARFLTQNSVEDTANRLVGSLRKAQIYSMSGKQNGTWGVKYTVGTKTLTLYLTGNSAFDENFTHNNNIAISGFTDIPFTKITGRTVTPATITITGASSSKTVTVNSEGFVSK